MTNKIAFIGSAGTGKSTLATSVFVELKKKSKNVELVTEWIRTDIQLHGPMKTIWEQYRTLHHQRRVEDAVPDNVEWVITDSGTLTPYFYSCLYTDKSNERERLCLADMFKFLIDDLYTKRYSHIFFLDGDQTYKDQEKLIKDGTRYQSTEELNMIDHHMRLVFTELFQLDNIYFLEMPMDERLQAVLDIIDETT